ncbi:MAG: hypothetical protein QOG44_1819 [Acidimicrobiaceae bacterium]|nr:hypothetical protein [Acidimicrobiaceae bacterium]
MNADVRASRASFAVRGAAAFIFGVLTLAWPGVTLAVLVLLWGAYVMVEGIFLLVGEIMRPSGTRRWIVFVEALAGIGAGIMTFLWPGITALALLWVIAAWMAVTGALEISAAFHRRRDVRAPRLTGVVGVLSIAAAVLLAVAPVAGALAITWAIAWYAIVAAVVYSSLAIAPPGVKRTASDGSFRGAHHATA